MSWPEETTLAQRQTVDTIVRLYEESVATIRDCFARLADTEQRLNHVLTMKGVGHIWISTRSYHPERWDSPEDAINALRLQVWSSIVDQLEITRFLSVRRARELHLMLEGKSTETFPEITTENVLAFARGFARQADKMLEEAVEEVFDWLRPPRSRYKSNSEFEVPRKVVLTGMVERGWVKNSFRVHYSEICTARVTALQNVFSAIDGKGTIAKTHHGALYDAINASGTGGRGETEYFAFRCFKNGNLHLTFKRLDLLDRFNQIAGGKRLRAAV